MDRSFIRSSTNMGSETTIRNKSNFYDPPHYFHEMRRPDKEVWDKQHHKLNPKMPDAL